MSKQNETGSGEKSLLLPGRCTEYKVCICEGVNDKNIEGNEVYYQQRLTRKLLKKYRNSVKDGI